VTSVTVTWQLMALLQSPQTLVGDVESSREA
jgi:hypothetical protein